MTPLAPTLPPSPALSAFRAAVAAARAGGNHAAAADLLHTAIAAHPLAAWPRFELAALLRDTGQQPQAVAVLQAWLARDPASPKAWLQLGLLHRAGGDPLAALAAFEQAHALDPANLDAVLNRVQESFTLGRQHDSDALLAEALRLDHAGVQALALAAQRAMLAHDSATALDLFERAIARCPWHVPSYIGACTALARLGRTGPAMAMIDHALVQCGSRPALFARRATLLKEQGLLRPAQAAAEQGLADHPDSFALWEIAMRLQILIGDEAGLRDRLATAPASRPAERAAVALLAGDIEAELGAPDHALAHYEAALTLAPPGPRLHAAMAAACLMRCDTAGAAEHLRRQTALAAPTLRLKSRSDDPADSYYGQIVNEYQLDRPAQALLAALPAEPEARIRPLRAALAACPGSTLRAVALLEALRRCGPPHADPAAPAGPSPIPPHIPNRIVQFWDRAPPADIAALMQTWPVHHPGVRHLVFDDAAARGFLHRSHPEPVLQAYHRAESPAMQADLFRLAYLQRHGGLYADADDRCTASLAPLLPQGASLVLYREQVGTLANNLIAATPDHPVITEALCRAVTAINRGDQDILWLRTGPGLITRCVAAATEATFATIRIWPRRTLLRHVSIHCTAGYKNTPQHWIRAAFAA